MQLRSGVQLRRSLRCWQRLHLRYIFEDPSLPIDAHSSMMVGSNVLRVICARKSDVRKPACVPRVVINVRRAPSTRAISRAAWRTVGRRAKIDPKSFHGNPLLDEQCLRRERCRKPLQIGAHGL